MSLGARLYCASSEAEEIVFFCILLRFAVISTEIGSKIQNGIRCMQDTDVWENATDVWHD